MSDVQYQIRDGQIISEHGMPYGVRYFADNRISFSVYDNEIGDINYFSSSTNGNPLVFQRALWGGLRFYIVDDGKRTLLEIGECTILPYGCTGKFIYPESDIEFCLFAASDSIILRLLPSLVLEKCKIAVEFYDIYAFRPQPDGDPRYKGIRRVWEPWSGMQDMLCGGFHETSGTVGIVCSSNRAGSYTVSKANGKHRLEYSLISDEAPFIFALAFDRDVRGAMRRCKSSIENNKELLHAQKRRYEAVNRRKPVLHSDDRYLDQFFALAPLYHESLKVWDHPGAMRANTVHYWTWGWDTLCNNSADVYWGDADYLKDMLDFFMDHSKDRGIAHAYNRDMSFAEAAPPPAQGFYIILLYNYYCNGGDVKPYYAFARRIFDTIRDCEYEETGLCKGTSLYPDFRGLIRENGNDISTFNNTVCYCAVRSMERLAIGITDAETANIAAQFAKRTRENFQPWLFDRQTGFIDGSVDYQTGKGRKLFGNNSVKWENDFCGELMRGITAPCIRFYKNDLIAEAGLRPVQLSDPAYDADANQLSCWWPVMSECFVRLANMENHPELIKIWTTWIAYWSKRLTCPEGISCYNETKTPPFDNWNALCGTWQAYSIRGWYEGILHSYVGVDFNETGPAFYPYSGPEVSVMGLHYGGRTYDIHMKGSGPVIVYYMVNGEKVPGEIKIPEEMLHAHTTIEVYRK